MRVQSIPKAKQGSRASASGCKRLVGETCTGPVCYCEERRVSIEWPVRWLAVS